MKRMTSRNEDCALVNGHALGYATVGELVQMAERLAAYEDAIGRTAFLTEEAARKALQEMEGKKDG